MSKDDAIEVVTIYTPKEANTYLLDDYIKNPTKAKVIKHLKYDKPPVVRMNRPSPNSPPSKGKKQ